MNADEASQRKAVNKRIARLEERIEDFTRTIETYEQMRDLLKDALKETRKLEKDYFGQARAAGEGL